MTAVNDTFIEKPLPSSEESERVLLGAVLLDNDRMPVLAESIEPADLYNHFHKTVYGSMLRLFEQGKNIHSILIGEELKKLGLLEGMGGVAAITNLTMGMPFLEKLDDYVETVREKRRLRDLIRACNNITSRAFAEEDDADVICDEAEQTIFHVCERPSISRPEPIDALAHASLVKTGEYMRGGVSAIGVPSGLTDLDEKTGGWKKQDLIIVAGRPSMGKTVLALQSAYHAADKDRVSVFFSLEMSKEQVAARVVCAETRTDLHFYLNGQLLPVLYERAVGSWRPVPSRKLYVDDTPSITTMQVLAKCRRIVAEHKRLDLVVVDYMQLMRCGNRTENRQQEVSQISRELKAIAKELHVPVLAVSQLSRAPEARNPPKPVMSDLRESGSIEQDADIVIFLYRQAYYDRSDDPAAQIIIAKQRNGPVGTVNALFRGSHVRFDNVFIEEDHR
jgi:replicative DNA helicase